MKISASALAMGCAIVGFSAHGQSGSVPASEELDAKATQIIQSSFRDKGIATVKRLSQDAEQAACSSGHAPSDAVANQIENAALASVKWPSNGRYIGDWKEGEKIAQSGRGLTWTDKPGSANGGSCYNCHQISKQELSFGTIGPSLYHYGKMRGVADPSDPKSEAVVKYTWAKLWNSKAYAACSNMPRFGHSEILDEQQIIHLMGLLLDPKSPVNQ